MSISSTLIRTDDFSQKSNFNVFLESHLQYLIKNKTTQQRLIPDDTAAVYESDFYGLLNALNIPADYHYITLRLNGFNNSFDFPGEETVILLPNIQEIDRLKNVFRTINSN